jgi:hypothetical protein
MEHIYLSCGESKCLPYNENDYDACIVCLEKAKQIINSNYITYLQSCNHYSLIDSKLNTRNSKLITHENSHTLFSRNFAYLNEYGKFYINPFKENFITVKNHTYDLMNENDFLNNVKKGSIIFAFLSSELITKLGLLLAKKSLFLRETCRKMNRDSYINVLTFVVDIETLTKPACTTKIN